MATAEVKVSNPVVEHVTLTLTLEEAEALAPLLVNIPGDSNEFSQIVDRVGNVINHALRTNLDSGRSGRWKIDPSSTHLSTKSFTKE